MNKEKIIDLAKFIHKFETDYSYREYLSEKIENKSIRDIAYKISCDSIDWIYFKERDNDKYSSFYVNDMGKKDGYIYVNMTEISSENINEDIAKLILKTAKDSNFLNDYIILFQKVI